MAPGFLYYLSQECGRHIGQTNQDCRIGAIVLGEEERRGIELHEHVPLADRGELQHQHGVLIPEPREEPAIHEVRGHAVGTALSDVGEPEQESVRIVHWDATGLIVPPPRLFRHGGGAPYARSETQ